MFLLIALAMTLPGGGPDQAFATDDARAASDHPPPINAVTADQATAVVERLYLQILHRPADRAGLENYREQLLAHGRDEQWVRESLRDSREGRSVRRARRQLAWRLALVALLAAASVVLKRRPAVLVRHQPHDGRRLWPWISAAWMLFLLNGVLISLLLSLPGGAVSTALSYAEGFIGGVAGLDSWKPMTAAILHLRSHPDTPLYTQVVFEEGVKFQYPPSSLPVMDFLQRLSGASWATIWALLNAVSWLCVPAIGLVSYGLLIGAHDRAAGRRPGSSAAIYHVLLMLASVAIVVTYYPITRSYALGQIQTFLTLLAGLSLLAWQRRKPAVAGLLLGVCCAVKPQWGVIVLWACLRRQWSMAAVCAATFGSLLLMSIAAYGPSHWPDYLSALAVVSRHGESFHPNQSVNGLVHRFLFNGNNVNWVGNAYPAFHPTVYGATLASGMLILGLALIWRMNKPPGPLDLSLIVLSLTMASPIAWEHHYGILLPIFALAAPVCLSERVGKGSASVLLVAAFFLTSQRLVFTNRFADTHLNVLQSHLFFGAVILLGLLYRASRLERMSGPPIPATADGAAPTAAR